MGSRRTGRERALQALFQLDQDPTAEPRAALEAAWAASDEDGPRDNDADRFAFDLVEGVRTHLASLDAAIEATSHNWRLERMARVDRNVLRLGAYELQHRSDIPRKVTLNEAVELGKKYGNEESAAFVNGLLDKLASSLGKA